MTLDTPATLDTPVLDTPVTPSPPEKLNLGLRPAALLLLCLLLIVAFMLLLSFGSVNIPFEDILTILTGGDVERKSWRNIILKVRLPKATTASLAGAALGVSGLMMQTFFRNPLAGPFVLGISSGASLGVAIVVLSTGTAGATLLAGIGLTGDILLAGAAALGSGITITLVLVVASRIQDSMTLLILGLMVGYFVSAVVSLLLHFTIPERVQGYVSWTFGSFAGVTWQQMPIVAGCIGIGLILAFTMSKSLNALLLGEAYARSLGMNLRITRFLIITATAILAGTVTAFCGPIGFLGIAVPHLCRALFRTSDHRLLVTGTMLTGAIVALGAAIISEVPHSNLVLPLNAITALMGSPVVMVVILRQRNTRQRFGS